MENNNNIKKCGGCGEIKHKAEFSKNKRMKDGLQTQCKVCNSKTNKKFRENNPNYLNDWFKANPTWCKDWKDNHEEAIVYSLTNIATGEQYFGSTKNHRSYRRNHHLHLLRRGIHWNTELQESFQYWGEDAFEFQILHKYNNEETARRVEGWYLDQEVGAPTCFNKQKSRGEILSPREAYKEDNQ